MIESAQWATPPNSTSVGVIIAVIDGVEWSVPDDMTNRMRQDIQEWVELGNVIAPYVAPPAPPYILDADVPWNRMTEEEAELVQEGIDASPVKTRNMINKATSFTQGTDAFIKFLAIIIAALSDEGRANAILGPVTFDELLAAPEAIDG